MPTQLADQRPTELITLTQALLARARDETDPHQLWTLAVISERLRQRLDACDRGLRRRAAAFSGQAPPATWDPVATFAELVDDVQQLEDVLGG